MSLPNIVFLVNGTPESAMGIRARSLAKRLQTEFRISVAYRTGDKILAIVRFLWQLFRTRPALCYVFDCAFSGVLSAGIYRFVSSCRMVVDTGDSIYDLARSTGDRGRVALWLTKMLEYFAFWASHCVIVRSHPHQEVLARRGIIASVIPDGVDTDEFQLRPVGDLLRKHGFEGYTVLGLLGSIVWNPRWEMCYGWELVEVIDRLRDLPIKGLVIGDGSGLEHLKMWCAQRGIEDRVVFLGRVDYGTLPGYISLMDICLSTQTNDAAGQVRTTGKLPLYLSCGRFVLSTDVGEASRVLPPQMLLAYDGTKDLAYPRRLAERVRILIESPEQLHQMDESVAIAQTFFDYDVLAKKMSRAISAIMRRHSEEREQGVESPLGK